MTIFVPRGISAEVRKAKHAVVRKRRFRGPFVPLASLDRPYT